MTGIDKTALFLVPFAVIWQSHWQGLYPKIPSIETFLSPSHEVAFGYLQKEISKKRTQRKVRGRQTKQAASCSSSRQDCPLLCCFHWPACWVLIEVASNRSQSILGRVKLMTSHLKIFGSTFGERRFSSNNGTCLQKHIHCIDNIKDCTCRVCWQIKATWTIIPSKGEAKSATERQEACLEGEGTCIIGPGITDSAIHWLKVGNPRAS